MRLTVKFILLTGAVLTLLIARRTVAQPSKPASDQPSKLWAAVSISPPVFDPDTWTIDRPKIHLGLVNDGTQPLETGLRESVLLVNGRPRPGKAWAAALKKGLDSSTPEKLSPGEHLVVVCPLEEVITEAGTYRVSWRGKDFQSSEVVYRRMPRTSDSKPKPAAAQGGGKSEARKEAEQKLWAIISIVPPVLRVDTAINRPAWFNLYLGNNGTETVDTGVDDSVLVVNGQPLRSRGLQNALQNGPFSGEWWKTPPGGLTGISRPLGGTITEPGTYQVSWRSKNFQSADATFRILQAKPK